VFLSLLLLVASIGGDTEQLDRYLAENRFVEAERILDSMLAKNPEDTASLSKLALLLYNNGFWDRALVAINRWITFAPADTRPALYRAATLAALDRKQEAESEYKRLLQEAASPEIHLGYAQLLHESGRFSEALVHIDKALEDLPSNSKLHFWRARILLELGRLDDAVVEGRAAVTLDPQRPQARRLLLKISKLRGDEEEARIQAEWLTAYQRARGQR
jgi:Flp pilus assembly protein TadD